MALGKWVLHENWQQIGLGKGTLFSFWGDFSGIISKDSKRLTYQNLTKKFKVYCVTENIFLLYIYLGFQEADRLYIYHNKRWFGVLFIVSGWAFNMNNIY